MKDLLKLTSLLCLTLVMAACSSDGGGSDDDQPREKKVDQDDENEAGVKAARDAWPDYTGDFDEQIDLTGYTTVTIIAFTNLTDNSQEEEAGEEFAEELEDALTDRYAGTFATVRVADQPLGQADEVVVRGHVYDFSNPGYSYWTGRSKAKFKAEMLLENGATGALLKSSRIKEDSYGEGRDEMLEEAAKDLAKMLAKSKG